MIDQIKVTTLSAQQLLGPLSDEQRRRLGGTHVLIAGLGNIGSHLAIFLAPQVASLRLLDRGTVDAPNSFNQIYGPADVGRTKVDAMADLLHDRFPNTEVFTSAVDLEDAPLGWFAQAEIAFGALHSLRGRQSLVSDRAWPLGVPIVDGAVGESWLGRIQVLLPNEQNACLECPWGPSHYRQLAQEYPCVPGQDADAPATLSPGFLGATVAGIMAAQGIHVLAAMAEPISREIAFDLRHSRFAVSPMRRAKACRFDHELIEVPVALGMPFKQVTVGDVLAVIGEQHETTAFHVESRRIILRAGGGSRQSIFTSRELQAARGQLLQDLDLSPADAWRVRFADGRPSVLLWLDERLPQKRSRT